jgi:hypothetical protein
VKFWLKFWLPLRKNQRVFLCATDCEVENKGAPPPPPKKKLKSVQFCFYFLYMEGDLDTLFLLHLIIIVSTAIDTMIGNFPSSPRKNSMQSQNLKQIIIHVHFLFDVRKNGKVKTLS